MKYKTGWISDTHLGSKACKAEELLLFLQENKFEKLYLVGDIIDGWRMKRKGFYWPRSHMRVIEKIFKLSRKGTEVIYIPGNHDEFVREFLDEKNELMLGNIKITNDAVHETVTGRKIWILHGDKYDTVVRNIKWLAVLGDVGYDLLVALNGTFNLVRKMFGLGYWSLAGHIKNKVKSAVEFITKFEDLVINEAKEKGYDGVICGHIHCPKNREDFYYNCGDWVDSNSALVEDYEGNIYEVSGR